MQAYLQLGQTGQLEDYLTELSSSFEQVDDVLRTGNVMADAILNSKLSLCRSHDIAVSARCPPPIYPT